MSRQSSRAWASLQREGRRCRQAHQGPANCCCPAAPWSSRVGVKLPWLITSPADRAADALRFSSGFVALLIGFPLSSLVRRLISLTAAVCPPCPERQISPVPEEHADHCIHEIVKTTCRGWSSCEDGGGGGGGGGVRSPASEASLHLPSQAAARSRRSSIVPRLSTRSPGGPVS